MVIGHSGAPKFLVEVIYNFHMPCFFLISGYLLKDSHFFNKKSFLTKRIKRLYVPFIKWSFIFLAFHFLFFKIHFYDINYNINDYAFKSFQILTMTGTERLLGGFWFLKELFYANIIVYAFLLFVRKFKLDNNKAISFMLPFLFLSLAYIASIAPYKIPTIGSVTLLSCSFFSFGYYLKKHKANINTLFTIISLLLTLIVTCFFKGSMDVKGIAIFPYFVVSITGSLFIFGFSDILSKVNNKALFLDTIGQASLYILTFHFLIFKFVSFLYISIAKLPIEELHSFPTISGIKGLWLFYGLCGILIPSRIWKLKKRLEMQKAKNK